MNPLDIKTVSATPYDCLVAECPYCGKEVIEVGCDLRDSMGWDFETAGELECPHCKKEFNYIVEE